MVHPNIEKFKKMDIAELYFLKIFNNQLISHKHDDPAIFPPVQDEAVDQSVNEDLTLFNRPLSADATGTWVEDDGPESQRPATATGNMPSQTGQPRLTRTPHTTSSQASPGSDSEDDGEGDGVLITEVKGDPEPPQGEVHLRRLRRRRPQEKQATPVDDGAEYDTDLEIDGRWCHDSQLKIVPLWAADSSWRFASPLMGSAWYKDIRTIRCVCARNM